MKIVRTKHFKVAVNAIGMKAGFLCPVQPVVDEHGFLCIQLANGYQYINVDSINNYTVEQVLEGDAFKFELNQVVKSTDGALGIVKNRSIVDGVKCYGLEALESDDVMPQATEDALEVVTDDDTGAILFVANKEDIPADAVIEE